MYISYYERKYMTMLTPKMHKIADSIGEFILTHYEQEHLETMFSFGLTIEDVIFQVLVICSRYAFLINSDKHPLSYFIETTGKDSELARKEHGRIIKYVDDKNNIIDECLKRNIGDTFQRPDTTLVKKANRFPEHEFTEFQYWEINNIHDIELIKSVVERRIPYSKKVPIEKFKIISEQYDNTVETMKANFGKNPKSTVFSSIQFFTLQTKYSFDFFYELAVMMEHYGIKEFHDMKNRLITVAGRYKCTSELPDICPIVAADVDRKIEYPLILQRRKKIYKLITDPEGGEIELFLASFIEANVLANAIRSHMHINGQILPLFFAKNTNINDWASVFETYNVFRTFIPHKSWTDAQIKSVRKMYDYVSLDYKKLKHPENRP